MRVCGGVGVGRVGHVHSHCPKRTESVCCCLSWLPSIAQSRCLADQFSRYLFSCSSIFRWCHPRRPFELPRSPESDKGGIRGRTQPSLSPQETNSLLTPGSLRNSFHLPLFQEVHATCQAEDRGWAVGEHCLQIIRANSKSRLQVQG